MKLIPGDEERRVVPRWRSSRRAAALGETQPSPEREPRVQTATVGAELAAAQRGFEHNPGKVGFAFDALSVALAHGNRALAGEALRAIHESQTTPRAERELLARAAAFASAEDWHHALPEAGEPDLGGPALERVRQEIRRIKLLTTSQPRSAYHWVDLALAYASLGQAERSNEAMRRALALNGNDRFVLRSAVRLLLHRKKTDEAWWLLRKSEPTRDDPWLLSAELAVASVLGEPPFYLKHARRALKDENLSAKSLSELRAGLGSLSLEAGEIRYARRLFREAEVDGTENALAQVVWATRRVDSLSVPKDLETRLGTFEARSQALFNQARWEESLKQATLWLLDEPFATRPVRSASFTAAMVLDDHPTALAALEFGLRANPSEFGLLNNKAFSLASLGRVDEARKALQGIRGDVREEGLDVAVIATRGFVAIRSGELAAGKELYRAAIAVAHERGDRVRECLALLIVGRECAVVGDKESRELLERGAEIARKLPEPHASVARTIQSRAEEVVARPETQAASDKLENPGR